MTISGRIPEGLAVHPMVSCRRSTSLSYPLGTVDGGVVADRGGDRQMNRTLQQLLSQIDQLDERARSDPQLVADIRVAQMLARAVLVGCERIEAVLGSALQRLDHGDDGFPDSEIDLRVETELPFPRTGGSL